MTAFRSRLGSAILAVCASTAPLSAAGRTSGPESCLLEGLAGFERAEIESASLLSIRPKPAPIRTVAAPEASEVRVSIPSHGGWTLQGLLTMPPGGGRAVILIIHGSGDYDMDGGVPDSMTADGRPGRLYKSLADSLAREGFAVLRYHKRGVLGWDEREQASVVDPKVFGGLEVEDLVADAAAAVRFLRQSPGAAGSKVLLLGHSEGTALAPLVAERERVDGLILMGAMARRLDAVRYGSVVEKRLEWAGSVLDRDRDGLIGMDELVPHRSDPFTKGVFFDLIGRFPSTDADGDAKVSMTELRAEFERTLEDDAWTDTPWYRSHLRLSPNSETLPSFRGPILILQGEKDSQTPLSEALILDGALRSSGHPDHALRTFPGLGHAFSPEKDGWKPTLGPMDDRVFKAVSDWARQRT